FFRMATLDQFLHLFRLMQTDRNMFLLTQHTDPEKALPPLLVRQQKAVDLITQCYQQMHMLSAQNNTDYKRMLRIFQEALDLQEHISVSLHQP
ncbi:FUSC family membrane protein, partial [Escherichia sp. HC-CC]